ncbi:AGE family epimerase/isomerase [Roseateles sp. DC23W]|uniref:AGE family epimerase/isomerase n=1 Tax=Pelomonas dachongensis TaxID=3299029 RepID=A0ABW7ELW1_9BURK
MQTAFDPLAPEQLRQWAERWRDELLSNVLPWWQRQIFDAEGRVLGGRSNDGRVLEAPRSAVLGTRLLWTFASAEQRLALPPRPQLDWAWAWVSQGLTDPEHGGVFWHVDAQGQPLAAHKQVYAQAFAIYALCAAHAARPDPERRALQQALEFFELLQAHAFDQADGGCWEGFTRDWLPLPGARLSDKEPPAPKTMNTMLHVLEALTELLRHHRVPAVEARLRELLVLFIERIWLPGPRCFGLFFSHDWRVLTPQVSWGHDIETAWLLVRAADVLGDATLLARSRDLAVQVADAVLARGVAPDGSVHGEGRFDGRITDDQRHWWCQAEAVVGFWDAWQISGDPRHANAAWRAWRYIDRHHVDRVGGDWFKTLDVQGRVVAAVPKAGLWECPYHHVRSGLEMIERLAPR